VSTVGGGTLIFSGERPFGHFLGTLSAGSPTGLFFVPVDSLGGSLSSALSGEVRTAKLAIVISAIALYVVFMCFFRFGRARYEPRRTPLVHQRSPVSGGQSSQKTSTPDRFTVQFRDTTTPFRRFPRLFRDLPRSFRHRSHPFRDSPTEFRGCTATSRECARRFRESSRLFRRPPAAFRDSNAHSSLAEDRFRDTVTLPGDAETI
jgi:hypothetical protein